jgi:DNA-binding response OmpR family regulator
MPPSAAIPDQTAQAPRPLKIFLAEDDPALRAVIALVLEKDGHAVRQARDGVDLMVDLAAAARPANDLLVVSDVRMPLVGGLAILRSLRQTSHCPPFILMTAFATASVRNEAEELGALALLDKPFHLDELRRIVRQWSQQRPSATTSEA